MSLSNPWIWCIASLGIGSNYQHFLNDIFDAKFVNDKGEGDVMRRMLPEGGSAGDRRISKLGEVNFKPVIDHVSVLFENRHAFADLFIDPAVGAHEAAY